MQIVCPANLLLYFFRHFNISHIIHSSAAADREIYFAGSYCPAVYRSVFLIIAPCQVCVHETVQISVQDSGWIAAFFICPVIFHHSIRLQDIRPNLASPSIVSHVSPDIRQLFQMLLLF